MTHHIVHDFALETLVACQFDLLDWFCHGALVGPELVDVGCDVGTCEHGQFWA